MKWQNKREVKEIIESIENIDQFKDNIILNGSIIALIGASGNQIAILDNEDILLAISNTLENIKHEYIERLEKL